MAIFCKKKLEPAARVGTRLKQTREEKNLTINEICDQTHVAKKYIEAIENGLFNELPRAKSHRIAYVRAYATALGLNPKSFLYQFSQETDLENFCASHPQNHLKIRSFNSLSFFIKQGVVALFILSFIGYLAWQVNGILQPPKLVIYTPIEGSVCNHLNMIVQGETEKETSLSVNGKEIMANDKGQFEIAIDLSNGVNTVTISAAKKHGKTTTITRHVVVKANQIEKVGMAQ